MRVAGIEITTCEELLVLPRPDGNPIPFRAKAVAVKDEFDRLMPEPVAPVLQKKGGKVSDLQDKDYLAAVSKRDDARFALMCLRSLEPSQIEWEQVKIEEPHTWTLWTDELKEAGLSEVEVNRVVGLVMAANALDEEKISEARKSFLLGQGE
jgi:hypothetical protein